MKNVPALIQGLYFLITGLWPLFSIKSFMKVTGPKQDIWLVKTVGVIVGVIGAGLVVAGFQAPPDTAVTTIAIGSAAGLAAIDIIYAIRKVISPIYLADALAEAVIISLWILY